MSEMQIENDPGPADTEPVAGYVWRPWKIAGMVAAGFLLLAGGALALVAGGGEAGPADSAIEVADGRGAAGEPLDTSAPGSVPGGESLLPGSSPPSRDPGSTSPAPTEPSATETGAEPSTASDGSVDWSPALLRGGFSFFVAFAISFAFRTFLKIALFLVGIWAGSLVFLAQAGWIEVHWDLIGASFESWGSGLSDEFASIGTFLTGSLPTAGMGGLGLYTGLRRR